MNSLDTALVELNRDALIATDAEGRVIRWSSGAAGVFGYSAGEAIGQFLEDLTVPAEKCAEFQMLLCHVSALQPTRVETIRRHKNGALLNVELLSRRIGTPGLDYVLFSERDVTDRQRAAEKFRGLLEAAPDAVVIVGPTGRIVLVNSQVDRLFGYPREELIGQNVDILLPEASRAVHARHRSAFVDQPRVRSMGEGIELYARRRDGTEFPVEISLSPLATEEGTLVSAAIRDITERKRVRVQLQEQNRQLTQANRAKSQFLASMSHELRTPLNAIIGFTETLLMLLAGPLNKEQTEQLQTVQAAGLHLLSLIDDLLDLTRIESGQVDMRVCEVDCREITLACVAEIRPLAQAKGLEIFHEAGEQKILVMADPRMLHQILLNLLGNAVKYTDRGSVRLQVHATHTEHAASVLFEVIDTGIGIAPGDHERLFQAFSQLGVPGRAVEGVGLGLYLSARQAEALGGSIAFRSTLGVGSVFTLTLPGG
jgi:PAS domain S-box-containing protein